MGCCASSKTALAVAEQWELEASTNRRNKNCATAVVPPATLLQLTAPDASWKERRLVRRDIDGNDSSSSMVIAAAPSTTSSSVDETDLIAGTPAATTNASAGPSVDTPRLARLESGDFMVARVQRGAWVLRTKSEDNGSR